MPKVAPFPPRESRPFGGRLRARLAGLVAGVLALFLALSVGPWAPSARAETFARPPVPAEFSSFDADWLHLTYPPELSGRVRVLKEAAAGAKRDLVELLGEEVLGEVHVRVARDHREMAGLAPVGAPYPKYASGVAYPALDLVLLTVVPPHPGEKLDLLQVFRHELLHVALHDALGDRAPRWFDEGLAVHASGELYLDRLGTLATATLARTLLPLRELTHRFPAGEADASVAYAQAADLVRYLLRSDGGHRFRSLIERMRSGADFESALGDAYGLSLADLESEWQKDVARRYTFWPVLLGGSAVWVVLFVLLGFGYARRKERARRKLAVWAREEAAEDARLALLRRALAEQAAVEGRLGPEPGVRLVLAAVRAAPAEDAGEAGAAAEGNPLPPSGGIPRIEHDGRFYTLH